MLCKSGSAELLLALVTVWENQSNVAFGFGVKSGDHRFVRKSSARPVFILIHAAKLGERACPSNATSTLTRSTNQTQAIPRAPSALKARDLTVECPVEDVLLRGQIPMALAVRRFASRPLELRNPRICPAAKCRTAGLAGIYNWKSHR
jgi:hypothetical protein